MASVWGYFHMVGDFIIWFKRIWKQQVTCRHDYNLKGTKVLCTVWTWYKCSKCGREKRD